jgi:DNA modification methylase
MAKPKAKPSKRRAPALKLDPKNARAHGERNKALIRQSLEEIGGFRSIGVDRDNIIRAGNGVYEQAQALGLKVRVIDAQPGELIAVRRPDLHGAKAERAALLDNRTSELSEWNTAVLADLPENLIQGLWTENEWTAFGFPDTMTEGAADAAPQLDKADHLQRKWKTACGQLWEIPSKSLPGKFHRLLCGNSTSTDDIARLMQGQQAALVSTDPPYLVDYTGNDRPKGSKDWSSKYREVEIKDIEDFVPGFVKVALAHSRENAAWFVWHASQRSALVERLLTEGGLLVHQPIIWLKPSSTLSYAKYRWVFEPCFFGWPKGHKPYLVPGMFRKAPTNVWEVDWEGKARMVGNAHPTQKPIELFARPMRNHTRPGEICYEPFSGSGSQLVAAENMQRLCYANEIEPAFVAVALQRMVDAFGIEPRLTNGKPKAQKKKR